jgi:hypothetical protein
MLPLLPHTASAVLTIIYSFIAVLMALAMLAGVVTFCRRSIRYCIVTWRAEGCGGRRHSNHDVSDGAPIPPTLEILNSVRQLGRSTPGKDEAGPERPAA